MSAEDPKKLAAEAKARGNAAFAANDVKQAAEEFSMAIELDPSDAVFWSNRSMCYATLGEFDKALEDGRKCLELRPDWNKSYSRTAFALYKLGQLQEAKGVYEQGLTRIAGDASLTEGLQQVEAELRQSNPMNQLFGDQMWTRLAMNPETRAMLGDASFQMKLRMLQTNPEMISSFLQDPQMQKALSVILGIPMNFSNADYPDAEGQNGFPGAGAFEEDDSMHAEHGTSEERHDEEQSQQEASHEESARAEPAPQAAQPEPQPEPEPEPQRESEAPSEEEVKRRELRKQADAEKEIGNEHFRAHRYDEALRQYERALEIDPTNAVYLNNAATVHFQQRDYEKSVEKSLRAVEVAHENHDWAAVCKAYLRLGSSYERMGRLEESIGAYEKALLEENTDATRKLLKQVKAKKEKRDADAYLDEGKSEEHKQRGGELFQQGKFVEAIVEFTEALKRNPNNYKVLSNRALCYTKLMDWQKALDDCEAGLKLAPTFTKFHVRKGKVHHFLKQYNKALSTYDQGLEIEPDNQELKQLRAETMMAVSMASTSGEVDEQQRLEALKDPEIQAIIRDPMVGLTLERMQNDPQEMMKVMQDPDMRSKIEKLIAAGVLRVGRK